MDYCGENVNPGWMIKEKEDKTEGNIKFTFKIKGSSGSLQSILIGDSERHHALSAISG